MLKLNWFNLIPIIENGPSISSARVVVEVVQRINWNLSSLKKVVTIRIFYALISHGGLFPPK